MFGLFNDDSFPKIRRSILTVAGLISFIAFFRVGVPIDKMFLNIGAVEKVIDPAALLKILWPILIYMVVRFGMHIRALSLRQSADLTKPTEVKKEADHYKQQLQSIVHAREKARDEIVKAVDSCQSAPELINQAARDFESDIARYKEEFKSAQRLWERHGSPDFSTNDEILMEKLENIRLTSFEPLKNSVENLQSTLERHDFGEAQLDAILQEPAVQKYEQQLSAESRSNVILVKDQWIASILVLAALIVAAWNTYHFFTVN